MTKPKLLPCSKKALSIILVLSIVLFSYVFLTGEDRQSAIALDRGLNIDPETLDPHLYTSSQARTVISDLGEGLLTITANGDIGAGAAETWELDDAGLVYTFHLREGLQWSNGESLTAADFVYSFRRLVDPVTAANNAQLIDTVENATEIVRNQKLPESLGVEAVGDNVLRIRLRVATPYFLNLLIHPSTFPVYGLGSLDAGHGAESRPDLSVSNGAYKLRHRTIGSSISLTRNPYYWDDINTKIDEVVYHNVAQDMEPIRFSAGELEVTNNVPDSAFAAWQSSAPSQLHVSPMLGVYYYGLNQNEPPFAGNLNLRRALSLAIDREVIVSKVTRRGEVPAYSLIPDGVANYHSQAMDYANLTQEERNGLALKYLALAGYTPADNLQFELRFNTAGGHEKIALAIQSMWRNTLGIDAQLVHEEFKVFISNIQQMSGTQVYRLSWTGEYNDAYSFLQLLESGSGSNLTGFSNDLVDQLLQQAKIETDVYQRQTILQQAETLALEQHPIIPIYFYVSKHLVAPEVRGWSDSVLDVHLSRHLSIDDSVPPG